MVPAPAGVVRRSTPWTPPRRRGPRASGSGPPGERQRHTARMWSPRQRGWSGGGRLVPGIVGVVPAPAGVVRSPRRSPPVRRSGPRASRGGPPDGPSTGATASWSPRQRGWSAHGGEEGLSGQVVPAPAGVVRARAPRLTRRPGGPRASGVVRQRPVHHTSPCGGPRASGGGPSHSHTSENSKPWSPRQRGWSANRRLGTTGETVVPARAGVVRHRVRIARTSASGPRASGGGPRRTRVLGRRAWWSPRERGWSAGRQLAAPSGSVVPARAGVVRRGRRQGPSSRRGPRASGGGPAATQAVRQLQDPQRLLPGHMKGTVARRGPTAGLGGRCVTLRQGPGDTHRRGQESPGRDRESAE